MSALLNNRYRILQTLGSGGCGRTFLAEDAHMPSKRRCVIKQLTPAVSDPVARRIIGERFQREAATLETLGISSDQIPSLHAYFTEEDEFYLVQDWIEGRSLGQKVREGGPLSESQARNILTSLLPVLDFVHSQGIIHRDIKPENIMLRERDGKPVLIDFGAVKEVVSTVVDADGSPTSSIVIGSPGFMPLEQAAGKPIFASDLYSLGLTAIYLLTGKRPKELTDLLTGETSWRSFAPKVSPAFADVLDKATRTHTQERYRTAKEMLAALQALAAQPAHAAQPSAAAPPPASSAQQANNYPLRREQQPPAAPPVAAARPAPAQQQQSPGKQPALIIPITPQQQTPEQPKPRGLLPKLTGERAHVWLAVLTWAGVGVVSGGISTITFQTDVLPYSPSWPGPLFGSVLYLFGEHAATPPIGKRKRIFTFITLIVLCFAGWYSAYFIAFYVGYTPLSFFLAGTAGGALIVLAELICWRFTIRRWIYAPCVIVVAGLAGLVIRPLVSEPTTRLIRNTADPLTGDVYKVISDTADVLAGFAIWQATVLAAHAIAFGKGKVWLLATVGALVWLAAVIFAPGIIVGDNSNTVIATGANTNYNSSASTNHNAGNANIIYTPPAVRQAESGHNFYAQGRYAEAAAAYREAARLDSQNHEYYNFAGNSLYGERKYAEAETEYRIAIRISPETAVYRRNLGGALYDQKKYAEAAAAYNEAIRLEPDNHDYYNRLGNSLYEQGKYSEAAAEYRAAIRHSPDKAVYHSNLGLSLYKQNNYAEAEAAYRQAVRLSPDDDDDQNMLGVCYYRQSKYAEAEGAYRQAVRVAPNNALYRNNLGDALYKQMKNSKAEAEYQKAVSLDPTNAGYKEDLKNAQSAKGWLDVK